MSEPPETEFDLEKLFLPAWAQESPAANKYAGFAGDDRRESRSDDRPGRRGPRAATPGLANTRAPGRRPQRGPRRRKAGAAKRDGQARSQPAAPRTARSSRRHPCRN